MMRTLIRTALAVSLTFGGLAVSAPAFAAPVKTYKNCTELNKDYKHGVAKKGAKDHVSSGTPVTNFTVNTAVYNANTKRDGDKDGVACEKK